MANDLTMTGHTAIVTGGTRGIGRAIVEALAAAGAKVAFTYAQSSSVANDILGTLNKDAMRAMAAKVEGYDQFDGFVQAVEKELGPVTILVNNAGVIRDQLLMSMSESEWNDVITTNLTGSFIALRPVAALMVRRRRGAIINISSIAASRPGKGHANYAASKGGLEALTKALAVELAPRGVRVNCVAPGMIETDMSKNVRDLAGDEIVSRIPMKRIGTPKDIAQAVMFLASDQSSYITGNILHVDGGLCV
jgi:3-oxoacyl-[acyl-carrier protein] reductase